MWFSDKDHEKIVKNQKIRKNRGLEEHCLCSITLFDYLGRLKSVDQGYGIYWWWCQYNITLQRSKAPSQKYWLRKKWNFKTCDFSQLQWALEKNLDIEMSWNSLNGIITMYSIHKPIFSPNECVVFWQRSSKKWKNRKKTKKIRKNQCFLKLNLLQNEVLHIKYFFKVKSRGLEMHSFCSITCSNTNFAEEQSTQAKNIDLEKKWTLKTCNFNGL